MPVAYRLAVVSHTLYGQDAIKWFYKSIISTAFVDNINKKTLYSKMFHIHYLRSI